VCQSRIAQYHLQTISSNLCPLIEFTSQFPASAREHENIGSDGEAVQARCFASTRKLHVVPCESGQ